MQDKTFFETKTHGKPTFPFAVYNIRIPEYISGFPLHWHNHCELIYVKRGRGTVFVQSRRYDVCAGDVVTVLPQAVHAIEQTDDSEMDYSNILFDFSLLYSSAGDPCYGKYLEPLYTHAKAPPVLVRRSEGMHDKIVPHIERLIELRNDNDGELLVKSELFAVTDILCKNSTATDGGGLMIKSNCDKLKNALSLVRDGYGEQISVETAAKACGYSESHFMKIFKELAGMGFTEYLINYRLEKAAQVIAETDGKIIDAAQDCGFGNPSYFSRMFAAKYGMSPSDYRNAAKSERNKKM